MRPTEVSPLDLILRVRKLEAALKSAEERAEKAEGEVSAICKSLDCEPNQASVVATAAVCSAKIMRHDFDKMLAALTEIHNMVGRAGEHGDDLPSLIWRAISGVSSLGILKSEAEAALLQSQARVKELEGTLAALKPENQRGQE